jgi:hypothetical protein
MNFSFQNTEVKDKVHPGTGSMKSQMGRKTIAVLIF